MRIWTAVRRHPRILYSSYRRTLGPHSGPAAREARPSRYWRTSHGLGRNTKGGALGWLLPSLIATLTIAPSCSDRTAAPVQGPATNGVVVLDEAARQHAGIEVAPVATSVRAQTTEAPGVIALDERLTARIGSLVDGIVLETPADVGDRVRAGQVLATMHSVVVHESWASYRKAVAERRRLEKELAFAIAAHERTRRLFADKAISLQDVQRAEADRVAAEEALDMGRTEVRRSEEELEHLGITNAEDPTGESGEQIPVKAPMAGVVLERLVTPGTAVTTGTALYVVSDLSALWALLEIDESLLSHVKVGQPIQVRVAAYPNETFPGTVALVGDMVNPKTRRVTVRCTLKNTDGRLKPQMYATAIVQESEPRQAIVIPASALQTFAGGDVVFVAESDGFRPRSIQTGSVAEGSVEVLSGLREGEMIAVAGSFVLKSELLKLASTEG
jgi:cobalt-zinc-cadmium efflux system membrane fusion protein